MRGSSIRVALCLGVVLTSTLCFGAEPAARLEGVWQFEKEIDTRSDGTLVEIPGEDFGGLLIYRSDGYMSVNLMAKGRRWSTDSASIEQLRTTIAEGTGYAGRYEVDEKTATVTHIASVNLEPGAEGKRLIRHYAFEGDRLVLTGEWQRDGEPMVFRVYWKRAPAPIDPKDPSVAARLPILPAPLPPLPRRFTADGGEIRTAILSGSRTPGFWSIGFALSIQGRVRRFKTIGTTPMERRQPLHTPPDVPFHTLIFGEEVVLYGGDNPTRLVRENGDVYDLEPGTDSTIFSFFSPGVVHTGYERVADLPYNPHPEAILDECRRLTDAFEHDVCLHYQAGVRGDGELCAEMILPERAAMCRAWLTNIRTGKTNR